MDITTILTLVSIGMGLLATLLGSRWSNAKGKLKQFKATLKEGVDVVRVAVDAVEDDKITPDEVAEIKQEAAEFLAAFNLLMAKE